MELLEIVATLVDLPEYGIKAGDTGTVVHIFDRPRRAYEVEFVDEDGATVAAVTLRSDQVRRVERQLPG
ncbi:MULTISPECIES: DUF4926 domain-containing protein [Protofrankia]|uniref:DUF4926 domain-containing protein n=1 Tax=Protofrankia coriariae TaxID=1562887 RepID=A0ABR5EZB1_9ACTN|nr:MULTISPECIES: DUF4926 domain-containing protein [Protofrankia]KLL09778.1 hypothetical protein FrCorBMG51_22540 [Protofrankia coriariae]ONH32208.1 hypothetical protein BL254_22075 [Protofrankia sp. BMG5.30]